MPIQKCYDMIYDFQSCISGKIDEIFNSHTYLQSTIKKSNGRKVCRSALPCPCDLITLITRDDCKE